jgi:hypothetical protein
MGPIPDPLPGLIEELITYPICEVGPDVRAVFTKTGGALCSFCRNAAVEEVDHIIPVVLGGPDRLENYAGTCQSCNMRKKHHLLPLGILGIMLMEAAVNAPSRRDKIEKRRAARDRANRSPRKEKVPSTRRSPHHVRLTLAEGDLLDLVGLDAMFRGDIPLDIFPDRLTPAVDRLLMGNLVEGPYADRLKVEARNGRLLYSREVASLWVSMLSLKGELPQVVTGPDWPAQDIQPRTTRNRAGTVYFANVAFPYDIADLLLRLMKGTHQEEGDVGGLIECQGDDAIRLHKAAKSGEGLWGRLTSAGYGGEKLFRRVETSRSSARIVFSGGAIPALEAMVAQKSASVILRETGRMMWDFQIGRTVPVRPGLLFEADQDWSAPMGDV